MTPFMCGLQFAYRCVSSNKSVVTYSRDFGMLWTFLLSAG